MAHIYAKEETIGHKMVRHTLTYGPEVEIVATTRPKRELLYLKGAYKVFQDLSSRGVLTAMGAMTAEDPNVILYGPVMEAFEKRGNRGFPYSSFLNLVLHTLEDLHEVPQYDEYKPTVKIVRRGYNEKSLIDTIQIIQESDFILIQSELMRSFKDLDYKEHQNLMYAVMKRLQPESHKQITGEDPNQYFDQDADRRRREMDLEAEKERMRAEWKSGFNDDFFRK